MCKDHYTKNKNMMDSINTNQNNQYNLNRSDYCDDYTFLLACSNVWDGIGKESWNNYYSTNLLKLGSVPDNKIARKIIEITPHFDGMDLHNLNLNGINLCYASLKGADLRGTDLSNAFLLGTDLMESDLTSCDSNDGIKYTNFEGANLQDAILDKAKMNRTIFKNAALVSASLKYIDNAFTIDFEGTNFTDAHLENSKFSDANLDGAKMHSTFLHGTMFYLASVNGRTKITGDPKKYISDSTNFSGVGLSGATICPNIISRLQRNIRKIYWDKWCNKHKIIGRLVRFFWKLSDYGSSSLPCIKYISIWYACSFLIYLACTCDVFIQALDISFFNCLCYIIELLGKTMLAMFGTGYIIVQDAVGLWYTFGILFAGIQAVVTYFLLAIIITRLGIMFQSTTP